MSLWEKTETDPELAFEVTVTLADHLAFNRHVFASSGWRRRRSNFVVSACMGTPLVAAAVCGGLLLLFQQTLISMPALATTAGQRFSSRLPRAWRRWR